MEPCPICYIELSKENYCHLNPCHHEFCKECILKLKASKCPFKCPLCRASIKSVINVSFIPPVAKGNEEFCIRFRIKKPFCVQMLLALETRKVEKKPFGSGDQCAKESFCSYFCQCWLKH